MTSPMSPSSQRRRDNHIVVATTTNGDVVHDNSVKTTYYRRHVVDDWLSPDSLKPDSPDLEKVHSRQANEL